MMNAQERDTLIACVSLEKDYPTTLLADAADEIIRKVGVDNVRAWVAAEPQGRRFTKRILARCKRIARA